MVVKPDRPDLKSSSTLFVSKACFHNIASKYIIRYAHPTETESKMAFDDLTAILYKKDDLRLEQKKPREPGTGEVYSMLNLGVFSF